VKKNFKIPIFPFWNMRAPFDVEKNYQEFTTEHTEKNLGLKSERRFLDAGLR